MIRTMRLLAIFFVIISAISCKNTPPPVQYNSNVVKIIKTKAFSLKKEFNEWVINKPEFYSLEGLGDNRFHKDFTWSTKYIDLFNNVIYREKFVIDEKGNEKIFSKISYDYSNPKEHKISKITTIKSHEPMNDTLIEIYKRDVKGVLQEVQNFNGIYLENKTVFSYNDCGQNTKIEEFEKKGLKKEYIYKYDKPSLNEGKKISTIINWYKIDSINQYLSSKSTYEYYWNKKKQLIKEHSRCWVQDVETENLEIKYSDFIEKKPTTITSDGIQGITYQIDTHGQVSKDQHLPSMHRIEKITYNVKGDVISFRSNTNSFGGNWENKLEYTYNKKNDWVKIILSMGDDRYLITQDIKYIDSQIIANDTTKIDK
ncbi:MAG: hypothetical protein HXX14_19125 [Bacteroidetes bacterium]|nr:hypothetical protein [Bacteroidota bacterium]